MAAIFCKDPKQWAPEDKEQAEEFLKGNKFFSEIYQRKHVDQILNMVYYVKISPTQPLYLTMNKRPASIILLSGCISINMKQSQMHSHHGHHTHRKRSHRTKQQGHKNADEYVKVAQLVSFNDTYPMNSECKVRSMHGLTSQCIFVPSFLYNKFIKDREQERNEITFEQLSQVFGVNQRKAILNLVKEGCHIREYIINNRLYRKGDPPEFVYIVLEGSIKIGEIQKITQKSSHNNIKIITKNTILGEVDLYLDERESTATCCSANARVLLIPKNAFLKFAKFYLPAIYKTVISYKQKEPIKESPRNRRSVSTSIRSSEQDSMKLPSIFRYRASMKSPQQEQKQYRLIRNSHILLDISPPKMNRIRSKSSMDQIPHDIMYKKSKLFKKIRPNARPLDLSNRIF